MGQRFSFFKNSLEPVISRNDKRIPNISIFNWRFLLPGGDFYKKSIDDIYRGLRIKFGPLVDLKGHMNMHDRIFTYNPDDFSKIYRTEGTWPIRYNFEIIKHYRNEIRKEIFEGYAGVAVENGEAWYNIRSVLNPIMMHPETVKLYTPKVDAITQDFIKLCKTNLSPNFESSSDIYQSFQKWALESIGMIALDTRLGALEPTPSEEVKKFVKNVRAMFDLLCHFEMLPPYWRYFKDKKYHKYIKEADEMTNFVLEHINRAKEVLEQKRIAGTLNEEEGEQSVFEKLMKINPKIAQTMAIDMIVSGVDTTGSSAIFILYSLAKNPQKQEILRQEILKILPSKSDRLTSEKMKNLPYLRATIKESMRMWPSVAVNARATGRDIVLQGYKVPKGTLMVMQNYLLMQSSDHYPRSDEFLPERWLNPTPEGCPSHKTANSFIFLPFGFGPRVCIGQRFALLELEVLVAKFVREFEIGWTGDDMTGKMNIIQIPSGEGGRFSLTPKLY